MNHIYSVHSQECNFLINCPLDCPASFQKYNSFYKHVLSYHRNIYDKKNRPVVVVLNSDNPTSDNDDLERTFNADGNNDINDGEEGRQEHDEEEQEEDDDDDSSFNDDCFDEVSFFVDHTGKCRYR